LKDGTYQDLGPSPEGIKQVELLRDCLVRAGEIRADALIARPCRRAQESAQILAPALGLQIMLAKGLEEWVCDDGRASLEECDARWQQVPEAERPFTRWMEGYETWLEFAVRVHQTLNRLAHQCDGKTRSFSSRIVASSRPRWFTSSS
jgi:probable phosphoglycerate mutase